MLASFFFRWYVQRIRQIYHYFTKNIIIDISVSVSLLECLIKHSIKLCFGDSFTSDQIHELNFKFVTIDFTCVIEIKDLERSYQILLNKISFILHMFQPHFQTYSFGVIRINDCFLSHHFFRIIM